MGFPEFRPGAVELVEPEQFAHPALLFDSEEEYLAESVRMVREGLAADEQVLVAVPSGRLAALADALGPDRDAITLLDITEKCRNPAALIPMFHRYLDAGGGRRSRILGEPIWTARDSESYAAFAQHEALMNLAFVDRPLTAVCAYDTGVLDPEVLAEVRATHPTVHRGGTDAVSEEYAPETVFARHNTPLAAREDAAILDVSDPSELSATRQVVADSLSGLSADRICDAALAVNELVTNSLRHTPDGCRVAIWRDGDDVVCWVQDRGELTDPLAGRRPPPDGEPGGRGLLLINELASLVRMHTSPHGTTVRVHL